MQLSGKLQTIELVIGIKEAIIIDKTQELMCRALLIGEEYSKADKPIKIEVGEIMTRKRRVVLKIRKNKKTYR